MLHILSWLENDVSNMFLSTYDTIILFKGFEAFRRILEDMF